MRGLVHSRSHISSVLLVSVWVLSTHVLWAQRESTPEESGVPLPDAPSRVATVSEAQTRFHLTYDPLLSMNTSAVLNHDTGTPEFWSKDKYFIGSALPKWMTFAPSFGQVHHETPHGGNDLDYYGHHIPWAGSAILRIGQQAKAHPHITTVLKSVHPKLKF